MAKHIPRRVFYHPLRRYLPVLSYDPNTRRVKLALPYGSTLEITL